MYCVILYHFLKGQSQKISDFRFFHITSSLGPRRGTLKGINFFLVLEGIFEFEFKLLGDMYGTLHGE